MRLSDVKAIYAGHAATPKAANKPIDDKEKQSIINHWLNAESAAEVARRTGRSHNAVRLIVKEYQDASRKQN